MSQVYHLYYLEWLGAEGFWFPQDRDHSAAIGVTEEQSEVPKCVLGEIQESMNGGRQVLIMTMTPLYSS